MSIDTALENVFYGRYGTQQVQCLQCGKLMRFVRPVARAVHTKVADTIYTRWECVTADCDNVLVIEDDHP